MPSSKNLSDTQLCPITLAYGDGIGPEIMKAVLEILQGAEARIAPEIIEIGESQYLKGLTNGISKESWDSLRRTRVFLKAPITTPQGGGYKSLNVTVRKSLGLYSNVRPCVTYDPLIPSAHPGMNVVIIRENEEDLYAGIEHRQTQDVYQCLKIVSEPGTRRIVRYAFEYARANGRKRVTCMTKDNIMKLTDGLFHRVFDEIGAQYPEIEKDHWIIDIGMAKVATKPTQFDVIVTPNLYGDILSDVAAEITGSVGLAPSANIGNSCAMFEAIHGSAPAIAGKDIANPSGLLLAAVMMLIHIGQPQVAERIHNAWLRTLEDGIHTQDIQREGTTKQVVGTQAFGHAVLQRLGQEPNSVAPIRYPAEAKRIEILEAPHAVPQKKEMVGIDVFVESTEEVEELARLLQSFQLEEMPLTMITNRGVKVWPEGLPETHRTDHWRCRFLSKEPITHGVTLKLLSRLNDAGIDFVKTEGLCTFDGVPGYSLGQGQ